jgi:hypothetical protein
VALERGGVLPEGASSPRARWSFARGGVQPSSEVEFRCCGSGSLERGGVSPEGCWGRLLAGPLVLSGSWSRETYFAVGGFIYVFVVSRIIGFCPAY